MTTFRHQTTTSPFPAHCNYSTRRPNTVPAHCNYSTWRPNTVPAHCNYSTQRPNTVQDFLAIYIENTLHCYTCHHLLVLWEGQRSLGTACSISVDNNLTRYLQSEIPLPGPPSSQSLPQSTFIKATPNPSQFTNSLHFYAHAFWAVTFK